MTAKHNVIPGYARMKNTFENVLSDNQSGSEELLFKINSYLKDNYQPSEKFLLLVRDLKKQTNDFQVIQEYLNKIILLSKNGEMHSTFFKNFEKMTLNSYRQIADKLGKIIPRNCKIITLSNSATLTNVFRILKESDFNLEVIVSESRPNLEGRIMAEHLDAIGIKTSLITEADIPHYIKSCNFSLIGADKILQTKNIVNKRGSKLLALLSKEFGIPFIVVARKDKYSTESDYLETEKDKKEIWNTENNSINMKNYYFEVIEKELISFIITD